MSILRVICANPQCQKILRIHSWQAGKRIRCPSCRVALIAPQVAGLAAATALEDTAAQDALDAPPPLWMTALFWLLFLAGFVVVVAAAIGFEVYLYVDGLPANEGPTATLLLGGPWKVVKVEAGRDSAAEPPAWSAKGNVWTFHEGGQAETGKLLEERNRYDRKPTNGFRTWTWKTDGNQLTLTNDADADMKFAVVRRSQDRIALTPPSQEEPILVLDRTAAVKEFPEIRTLFYGGILAPMLCAFLLAWLISREVFYAGCLRFALGWPLTAIFGLALGAGAGYLLDVLDDYSHPVPYWLVMAFAQGILSVFTGFYLAVLSCLRPA